MVERREMDIGDAELLHRALAKPESLASKRAASQLLKRYQSCIYGWCLRHVGERERALDLTQEVLIKAYRKLDSFEETSQFSSWLFTIVRNCCISALRQPSLLRGELEEGERRTDPAGGSDLEYELREEQERLRRLMLKYLTPLEQEVLWLRCFERMPVDEITETLTIRSSTGARGILQSARRKLRRVLPRSGGWLETS